MRPVANPKGNSRPSDNLPVKAPRSANIPTPPDSFTDMGVELWDRLWEVGAGIYSPKAHIDTITRYVELQQRRTQLLNIIEDEGWTTIGSQGQVVLHPLARQVDSIEGKLVPLEDRLGLSPESSLRLGIASVEAKSKLDAFLEGMN